MDTTDPGQARIALKLEALASFDLLFEEALAAGEPDPTAMVLATAGLDARPSARTVLLKARDERGFVFYTHLDGRKGRELQANPHAALLFHWPRVAKYASDSSSDTRFTSPSMRTCTPWRTRGQWNSCAACGLACSSRPFCPSRWV